MTARRPVGDRRAVARIPARVRGPEPRLTGRRAPRWLGQVVLPTSLVTTLLMVGYFGAPLDRPWTAATAVALVAGLLLVGMILVGQARAVVRSPYPLLRAVAVLAISFPVLMLLFATSYLLIGKDRPGAFSEPLTKVASLYFTLTVFTTVGFGDITARTDPARIAVMLQMLVDLIYVSLLVRSLVEAARTGVRRRARESVRPPDPPRAER
jgi:hypothetical protein